MPNFIKACMVSLGITGATAIPTVIAWFNGDMNFNGLVMQLFILMMLLYSGIGCTGCIIICWDNGLSVKQTIRYIINAGSAFWVFLFLLVVMVAAITLSLCLSLGAIFG